MNRTPEEMIDRLVNCTLATVEDMLFPKSISKAEFKRQCDIAQEGINFLGKNYSFRSRAKDIVAAGVSAHEFYLKKRAEVQARRA